MIWQDENIKIWFNSIGSVVAGIETTRDNTVKKIVVYASFDDFR